MYFIIGIFFTLIVLGIIICIFTNIYKQRIPATLASIYTFIGTIFVLTGFVLFLVTIKDAHGVAQFLGLAVL